jgi:hypothetical protein
VDHAGARGAPASELKTDNLSARNETDACHDQL